MDNYTIPEDFQDNDIIADPLYGLIPISMFEKRIINTPEFQRLRNIKQLGFAHFVYPAAEHSRFVHSIGVCHQAKNMVDIINSNMKASSRYSQYRLNGKNDQAIDALLEDNLPLISPFERIVISAAALIHDLPHGPFSHEIEGAMYHSGPNAGEDIIPQHDEFSKNPVLFLYLFSKRSVLASVIRNHNRAFFNKFKEHYSNRNAGIIANDNDFSAFLEGVSVDGMIGVTFFEKAKEIPDRTIANCSRGKDELISLLGFDNKTISLPILGVMIYEIHLFEKQYNWLVKAEERKTYLNLPSILDDLKIFRHEIEYKQTIIPYSDIKLEWIPIPGWFRAYRKDIIGNTICADLIDYIKRDGYHSGIISEMDLKFLDRMFIARKILPNNDSNNKSKSDGGDVFIYADIPVSCEHVVFDVWDHKRGCYRHSIFTEMIAYLQARYLLCERVYTHRVVEAARSMLHETVSLLAEASTILPNTELKINLLKLHPSLFDNKTAYQPDGDLSLLKWIINTCDNVLYDKQSSFDKSEKEALNKIRSARDLAAMLLDRRVFREGVIVDGVKGYNEPLMERDHEECKRLEKVLISTSILSTEYSKMNNYITRELRNAYKKVLTDTPEKEPAIFFIYSIRKWAKKFKQPIVLVSKPSISSDDDSYLNIAALCDCKEPDNIKKQLNAMRDSFDSLWKVFLFVHPVFHLRNNIFKEALENVWSIFKNYIDRETKCSWKNSLIYNNLLPKEPMDVKYFVYYMDAQEKEEGRANELLNETVQLIYKVFEGVVFREEDIADEKEKKIYRDTNRNAIEEQILKYRSKMVLLDNMESTKRITLLQTEIERAWPKQEGVQKSARSDYYCDIVSEALEKIELDTNEPKIVDIEENNKQDKSTKPQKTIFELKSDE